MNIYIRLILIIIISTSCTSVLYRGQMYEEMQNRYPVYLGAQRDIERISADSSTAYTVKFKYLFNVFHTIDLPFSFVVDTLCLPYDLIYEGLKPKKITNDNIENDQTDNKSEFQPSPPEKEK